MSRSYATGKFGPIVKHQETIVPIKKSNKRLEEITLKDALELLPESITGDITVKNGQYGAYFSYNGKNYSLKMWINHTPKRNVWK